MNPLSEVISEFGTERSTLSSLSSIDTSTAHPPRHERRVEVGNSFTNLEEFLGRSVDLLLLAVFTDNHPEEPGRVVPGIASGED